MDEEAPRLKPHPQRRVFCALGRDEALDLLGRGAWQSILKHVRGTEVPIKSECVWLPAYIVTVPLTDYGNNIKRLRCSIDGLTGAFAFFAMEETLGDATAESAGFPTVIGGSEAESLARSGIVTALLRRRRKSVTAQLGETESIELVLWPYWVFYYRRRNGAMDIRVVDAATGTRAGHKTKLGLLEAFRAAAAVQQQTPKG